MVHAQENGAQLGALHDLGLAAAVDAGHVLQRNGLDHIDLTAHQRGHTGGIVANGRVLDIDHIAFDLAPVRCIALKRCFDIGLALAQTERTGTVGFE